MRILLVEDHAELAERIARRIRRAGYCVDRCGSLREADMAIDERAYSIALLDRRLPDGDGLSLISPLRCKQPGSRILILSALDALDDRIEGLDAGADDYLVKPFDGDELMARVRARLRSPSGTKAPAITAGDLSFDASGRQFCVADMPMNLHKREFTLLESLMRRIDRVVARSVLMEEVYGFDDMVSPGALDTLVSRLRKRLESVDAGVEIHLVRGRGYLLSEIGS